VSPSEDKGLALGLRLLSFDRANRTTMIDGKPVKTKVYARFEAPRMGGVNQTNAVLHSYSKSRAGAWRHAIRWLRQLQRGKLR